MHEEINSNLTWTELYHFYHILNPRTNKYRWQHMDPVRMTKIMVMIAENADTVHLINKAYDWLDVNGTV